MVKLLNEIDSVNWQPKKNEIGEIVEGIEEIEQCIENILQTRKGSVPHNPEFGSDAWLYLDKPVNIAIPNIIRETIDAINMWEKRVSISNVNVETQQEHITISISWNLKGTELTRNQEVEL